MFLQCGRPFIIDLPGRVYSSWKMKGSTFRGHSREQEQYHIQAVSWSTIDYSVPVNLENVLIVWYFQPWKDWVSGRRWISAKLFYTPLGRLCDCTQSLRERRHMGKAEVASASRACQSSAGLGEESVLAPNTTSETVSESHLKSSTVFQI